MSAATMPSAANHNAARPYLTRQNALSKMGAGLLSKSVGADLDRIVPSESKQRIAADLVNAGRAPHHHDRHRRNRRHHRHGNQVANGADANRTIPPLSSTLKATPGHQQSRKQTRSANSSPRRAASPSSGPKVNVNASVSSSSWTSSSSASVSSASPPPDNRKGIFNLNSIKVK